MLEPAHCTTLGSYQNRSLPATVLPYCEFMNEAALTPTQVIARRVREYRMKHGWSARELGERCAAAGLPKWERNLVANLENGRRENVSIEEVLVLAYVLSVPPLLLFVPLGAEDHYAVTPHVTIHPDLAMQWIEGEIQPVTTERFVTGDSLFWLESSRPITLYRRLRTAQAGVNQARSDVKHAEYTGVTEAGQKARAAYLDALRGLASVLDDMIEASVRPPAIWSETLTDMRGFKLLRHPDQIDVHIASPVERYALATSRADIAQIFEDFGVKTSVELVEDDD